MTYIYTCPLCREMIKATMVEPLSNANKRDFAQAAFQWQMAHVQQAHREVFSRLLDLASQYNLALFQKLFICTDPALIEMRREILDCAEKTITGDWDYFQQKSPEPQVHDQKGELAN